VERLLSGTAMSPEVPPDLAPLAAVMEALRQEAHRPVRPSPRLAALMSTGFRRSPEPAHHARPPGPLIAALARITRVRAATVAAAAGVAVAVTGVATAGFAGVLPPEVQDRFEVVVEAVTPYEFKGHPAGPDGPGTGQPSDLPGDPSGPPEVIEQDRADAESGELEHSGRHGQGVDGRDVSEGAGPDAGAPGSGQPGPPEGGPPGQGLPEGWPPGHGPFHEPEVPAQPGADPEGSLD
jgi:hypothetical protein